MVTTAPGTWCVETNHRLVKVIHVWSIWQLSQLNILHTKQDTLHIKCIVPVMVSFHTATCTVYLVILRYCLVPSGPQTLSLTHGNKNGGEIRASLERTERDAVCSVLSSSLSLGTSVFLGSFGLSSLWMFSILALCVPDRWEGTQTLSEVWLTLSK